MIEWSATARRLVLLLAALQSCSAWKAAESHLPAFLYHIPTRVFSPFPPGYLSYPQRKPVWSCRVLLFWLSGSQTSSEHSSVSLSLLLNRRSPYTSTEIPGSPPRTLLLLEIRHCCFTSRKQQNYSFIQNAAEAVLRTAVLRTAVLAAYGPCRMQAMSAMYFIQDTVAIIVIPRRAWHNGEGYNQEPDTHCKTFLAVCRN